MIDRIRNLFKKKSRREQLIEDLERIQDEYEYELVKYIANIHDFDITCRTTLFLIIEYIKSDRTTVSRNI